MVLPFNSILFWLKLLAITLVTGCISGSYPALFLSGFSPTKVLKGTARFGWGTIWLRKSLVVFQFVLSIVLITGTIVVSKQVTYLQQKNLGYDRENLIYVPLEGELIPKYALFKQEAVRISGIQSMSEISDNPIYLNAQTNNVEWGGRAPSVKVSFEQQTIDYDFIRTMKLKMAEGRDFSPEFGTDNNAYILNETGVKDIGYTNPIGRIIAMNGMKGPIVGVIKDFHFRSLQEAIHPLILRLRAKPQYGSILIRTQPGKTSEVLTGLEALCHKINPQFPFTFTFSDEAYQRLYLNEQVIRKLSDAFSFLAIFISCLGLLGLVMFSASQRTKEIGIRKVLGASVMGIVQLMSVDFLKLIGIAIVIACPIAWWAMSVWLNNYAYKIAISWWMFVLAGGTVIFVAAVTISFQSIKSALANPAASLKTE
jgi:hypothetical protein